ncbi:hypothetical protein [Mycobacterium servetii]|uniref:Uncharacterized protein n=1 Tax=Mycobacterium servetii TaxID=3237418 RepID=A0ABV4C988_9MYCO
MSIAAPPPAWPPPPYPPGPPPRVTRRWPLLAAAAAAGAIIAATAATLITIQATPTPVAVPAPPALTVTETAKPPAPPAPLPAPQADAQTCHGWGDATALINAANKAQSVLPDGMTITNPEVRANPAWTAAVTQSGHLLGRAGDTLATQLAPGTSPMLADMTNTTVSALHTLSIAFTTFDPANGDAMTVFQANQQAMNVMCHQ